MNHTAELAALKTQVQSLEQLQELLLYTATHELRTPVMTIMGFTDLMLNDMKDQPDTMQLLPALERIRTAAQRQGHMLQDLQRIATHARQPLRREPVNLGELLRELLKKQAAPAVQISPCSQVFADPELMKIALESLLKIATKLVERGTTTVIEFAEQPNERFTTYALRIGGTGFDLGAEQSLLAMFRRLQAGNEYAGTGIALLELTLLIQRHGGTLWISTRPDMEMVVNFTVPQ